MLPLKLSWDLSQTRWSSILNPIIKNEILQGVAVDNVALINGVTVVNHKLQRKPQGWFLTDVNAAVTVYRSQPFNDLTLTLTANASATASLWVY